MLAWYRPRRAAYPWRRGPTDPYRVLVSEVMAQQTQAPRVAVAFDAFIARFPSVGSLAAATRADVLRAWAGLGYNRRAVALHETARAIVRDHGGEVPRDVAALRALPGVGPYTAAAVASIAFGEPVAAIDTNVRRVIARAACGAEPDDLTPAELRAGADVWLDRDEPGTWNQALMDIGRVACRPRNPRCRECPLAPSCALVASGRKARPAAVPRPAFPGSSRQARGAIVRALREGFAATSAELATASGLPAGVVAAALASLVADGLLEQAAGGGFRLHGDVADSVS